MKIAKKFYVFGLMAAVALILSGAGCKKKPAGGDAGAEKKPAPAASSGAGLSGADLEKAKAAYTKATCNTCHGESGKADTANGKAMKARDFTMLKTYKQGTSEADVFKTITNGVPGTAMAGYKQISEADRKLIAKYVVHLQKQ